jgi:hypothetical protein
MSLFGALGNVFTSTVSPVTQVSEALGGVINKVFTTDAERAQAMAVMQVELNKIEAQHQSIFVAGWRPFLGWICGISLAIYFIPQFILASYLWVKMCLSTGGLLEYPVSPSGIFELTLAILGIYGTQRTVEKIMKK